MKQEHDCNPDGDRGWRRASPGHGLQPERAGSVVKEQFGVNKAASWMKTFSVPESAEPCAQHRYCQTPGDDTNRSRRPEDGAADQQVWSFVLEDLLNKKNAGRCINYANLTNPKSFPSVPPKGFGRFSSTAKVKQRQWTVLEKKKCKTASLFQHFAENTSLPKAQLGPEQNIFLFMHLTPPSVCRLARLSLMHLFVGEEKKNTCISLSQLNCSEALPSRTGQMWGRDLQKTTPSLSSLIPLYKSLSITAPAVVL